MSVLLLIVGLVLFVGLVVVHEWGHFIMARRGGVEVEEFSIFFPPKIYSRTTKGGWKFSIGALPLGGYVKLKGEHDTDTEKGSYGAASVWTKTKIMAAGVAMNFITAYVLFVLLALVGLPHIVKDQFVIASDAQYESQATYQVWAGTIEKNSPAGRAGLAADDRLIALGPNGHAENIKDAEELPKLTHKYAGQSVTFSYEHKGKTVKKPVTLRSESEIAAAKKAGKTKGYLGVSVYESQKNLTVVRSTWSAPIVAAGVMKQFTVLTFQGLGKAVAGLGSIIAGSVTGNQAAREEGQTEASSQVSGPLGIFFVFKYGAELGIKFILLIVAIISLTLAIMNILPIPALDGGRLWLTLISRGFGKPLTPGREELINAAGFIVLIGLIIVITVVDAKRFF
jgi:regulator of sigma E protease